MTAPASLESPVPAAAGRPRILLLGGGFVGLLTARHLLKQLKAGEAQVVVVDPRPYMTYAPFLPEVAGGSIEARHVVVSLRQALKGADVVTGTVTGMDPARKVAFVQPQEGEQVEISYDQVVVGLGAVSRVFPIPGLMEQAIGFKSVEEATACRDHILDRLDAAAVMTDPAAKKRALTFVFVGGGYAGIEAMAELEDLVRASVKNHSGISQDEINFVVVEALGRILPEVGPEMGLWSLGQLRERGIDIRLDTQLKSVEGGHAVLSDGTEFDTDTVVWTAGIKSNPVLAATGLPLDKLGRLTVRADLRVAGDDGVVDGAWGAGDACAVPDLTKEPGQFCPPNAQHAVRESKTLAANIVATLRGEALTDYRHKYIGTVASFGIGKGVANTYGLKVKGFPAWLMHRGYHLYAMPTLDRKVRIALGWAASGMGVTRDLVAIGRQARPREEFVAAGAKPPAPRPVGDPAPSKS